jgi:membrane dipeptidase
MRLIDLYCNWAMQYACETTHYDPGLSAVLSSRVGQVEGYLSGTGAAILACRPSPLDWERQADPWQRLGEMLARYEAEFSGRLLTGPEDVARWNAEPQDALCWGVLATDGLDVLVRESVDLCRLPDLYARGVRVFQLVGSGSSEIGGSARRGDDRGLTDLERALLDELADLAPPSDLPRPRPVVDLAGLNARSTADVLSWSEADAARRARLLLLRSHGAIGMPGRTDSSGLTPENLARLRALGGVVGLSPCAASFQSPQEFRAEIDSIAAIPFEGREGYEGIGVGSCFPTLEQTILTLATVPEIASWLSRSYPPQIALQLAQENARGLLLRAAGSVAG